MDNQMSSQIMILKIVTELVSFIVICSVIDNNHCEHHLKPRHLQFHKLFDRSVIGCFRLGFPEVDLGILPAAAGTQRFPRLAGLKAALEYIPTGLRFSATKGKAIG